MKYSQTVSKLLLISLGLLIVVISWNYQAFAGVEALMKFTDRQGSMSNVNKATVIKDQESGYMTGGSIIQRGPRPQTLQPLLLQTPKFNFDACTGSMDARFGSISYVTSKEFMKFFKSMKSAAGSYAVKMLIKTACPQCEDIMTYLETVSRDINGLMIDQCSAAQKIAGGAFGMLTNGNQQKCMMQSNIGSEAKDMFDTMDKCKTNPDRFGSSREDGELKSMLGSEFNLVWKALSQSKEASSSDNDKLKEFIMSISGTVIGIKESGKYEFTPKPSLVLDNKLLEQYIGLSSSGGKVKLYKCQDKVKCLILESEEVTLTAEETLYGNVEKHMKTLVDKIAGTSRGADGKSLPMSGEEELIVSLSSVPIIRLIEMELANKTRKEDVIVRMRDYLELICYDMVTSFLIEMSNKAQVAVEMLEYSQVTDIKAIKEFSSRAKEVKSFLNDSRFTAFKRLQIVLQVKERLQNQEKLFKLTFGKSIENIN